MTIKNKKIHITEVLDDLVGAASRFLKYRIGVAMGETPPAGHENYNPAEQKYIIELVKPLLEKAQQSKAIEANSSRDVIILLTKGKITPNEAKELLMLMKDQTSVEKEELKVGLQRNLTEGFIK
ncbi:MAG: hypothetical protein ABUK08_00360 [Candidatus Humimicrobiaceae bacterium]